VNDAGTDTRPRNDRRSRSSRASGIAEHDAVSPAYAASRDFRRSIAEQRNADARRRTLSVAEPRASSSFGTTVRLWCTFHGRTHSGSSSAPTSPSNWPPSNTVGRCDLQRRQETSATKSDWSANNWFIESRPRSLRSAERFRGRSVVGRSGFRAVTLRGISTCTRPHQQRVICTIPEPMSMLQLSEGRAWTR